MAQSNRHWPSMFKSKPCTATGSTTTHHHNPASHLQHDINSSLTPSAACKIPFSTGGGCDERSPEPKPRWNPKPEQIRILEAIFNSGMVNPPRDEIRKIRTQLQEYGQVGDANVFYWFQNRKSRSKHKNRHLSKNNTANNNNTIHNNNNQTTTQSPNSLHGTAPASALAAPAPTSSSSSSEKSYYPRDKILKMSTTNNNNNNVGVDVSNLNSPTGSVNQTYLQAHLMNDYFHQAEPQQQFFFPVQQSGTIVSSHLHHPAYSTQQTALCFNDLSAAGGGSTSSGSVVTGGGGSSGIEQQRGGIGSFSSLLLGEMIGGGGSAVNNNNSPVPPATVNATRRGEVVVGNDEEEKLNFHHHQQQQGHCFFVTNTNPAATTNTINNRPAVAVTTSISSLSQIQGVGDQSNAVVDPPLKSTVFINDVAFDVPVGPFSVRDAFGDDALLVNAASGQPVLTNEWGITLQSLLHGGSYYLVRALPATPAILFDRQHDQTDLLAQPEFPFQI